MYKVDQESGAWLDISDEDEYDEGLAWIHDDMEKRKQKLHDKVEVS